MKKRLLSIFTVLFSGLMLFAACGGGNSGDDDHIHSYDLNTWLHDDDYHWHPATCEHTDQKGGRAEHNFGDDNICDDCHYEKHVHEFDMTHWERDEQQHWRAATCGHTEVKGYLEDHTYDASGVCTKCEYAKNTHLHTFAEDWTANATQHWHAPTCVHDTERKDGEPANHVWDGEDGTCSVCGYDPSFSGGGSGGEDEEPISWPVSLTIHYNGNLAKTDLWLWTDSGSISAGGGRAFTKSDSYGGYLTVEVPEGETQVGFIVRTNVPNPGNNPGWDNVGKDGTDSDRSIPISSRFVKDGKLDVYLKTGDANNYIMNNGALEQMKLFTMADMTTTTRLVCKLSPTIQLTSSVVKVYSADGRRIAISKVQGQTVDLANAIDVSKPYIVTVEGYGSAPVIPSSYFSNREFISEFQYTGKLGVDIANGVPTFRLWAPTASEVKLNIYEAGSGGEAEVIKLTRGNKGVWIHTGTADMVGKYYTYTVTTSVGEQEAVDPYAVSTGVNGQRGMILDLNTTDPDGWTNDLFVPTTATDGKFNYTDANIWEVHVRDFSIAITDSDLPEAWRGKFLAFTKTGLTNENGIAVGLDHLKELGITHVHLNPAFDFSSVDESGNTGYNWGYDPQNYNVPEGSYSTNPNDGAVRVKEFKQMVQALHANGIGVIMDVVYNHTSGLNSNFTKIVPYYYYRYGNDGKATNGSGCGNETASERMMVRKFMIDSVTHWLTEYNVDGFRFDLMALHDTSTMRQIEQAVHKINPNAILYGEGWTGGGTPLTDQSSLQNIKQLNGVNPVNGIAMFDNTQRDALKGSTNGSDPGFATGAVASQASHVMFGVYGGSNTSYRNDWDASNPTQVINYASAHDNLTLWDKIVFANGKGNADNYARNRLTAAIVQTSLGTPFMLAGEEMLRSKPNATKPGGFDENSYNSGDEVNKLRWDKLSSTSEEYKMTQYYKGLIAFRKAHPVLRSTTTSVISNVSIQGTLITFQMSNGSDTLYIVYNAGTAATSVNLPTGNWGLYINGTTAGTTQIGSAVSGSQSIAKISCYVFVKQ